MEVFECIPQNAPQLLGRAMGNAPQLCVVVTAGFAIASNSGGTYCCKVGTNPAIVTGNHVTRVGPE